MKPRQRANAQELVNYTRRLQAILSAMADMARYDRFVDRHCDWLLLFMAIEEQLSHAAPETTMSAANRSDDPSA